ncbi:unnamed protein product [Closterium sp. NIES-65]|nr:unnamed protein product [Closterium sp. NIES-65]
MEAAASAVSTGPTWSRAVRPTIWGAAQPRNPIQLVENHIPHQILEVEENQTASGAGVQADVPAVAAVAPAVASPLRGNLQGEATSPSNSRATGVTTSSCTREADVTSASAAPAASAATTDAGATSAPLATAATAATAAPHATAAVVSHADFIIRAVAPSAGVALWEALRRATDAAATAVASLHTWQAEDCADVDEACSREFWAAVTADDAGEEEDWILAVDSLGLWWLFGHLDTNIGDNVGPGSTCAQPGLASPEEEYSDLTLNKESQLENPGEGVNQGVIVAEAAGAEQLEQLEQRGQQDGCTSDTHRQERPEGCYAVRVFVSEFEARAPFLHFSLSEHAARVAASPNAGGASVISESLSVEYFVRHFGATDIISEMEIKYCDSNWKKVDYICSLFGQRFGVSVTRAMMYPDPALFDSHRARALLRKKLHGLVVAWSGISPMHCFSRAILHVWCETSHIANLLQDAFPEVSSSLDMQEDVLMVLTVAEGHQGWPIFYESLYKFQPPVAAAPNRADRPGRDHPHRTSTGGTAAAAGMAPFAAEFGTPSHDFVVRTLSPRSPSCRVTLREALQREGAAGALVAGERHLAELEQTEQRGKGVGDREWEGGGKVTVQDGRVYKEIVDEIRLGEGSVQAEAVFLSEFEARAPFVDFTLSEDAVRVASSPNAGGASVISESLSVEYFVRHFGASDIISEMEVQYCDSNWKKVDYICSLFGQRFGVSVTRAMMYPDPGRFDYDHAKALLRKKLHGLAYRPCTASLALSFTSGVRPRTSPRSYTRPSHLCAESLTFKRTC